MTKYVKKSNKNLIISELVWGSLPESEKELYSAVLVPDENISYGVNYVTERSWSSEIMLAICVVYILADLVFNHYKIIPWIP